MKRTFILVLIIFIFTKPAIFAQYIWTEKSSMSIARYIGCGFTIGGKSYVGTGYSNTATALSDWWVYNPLTDSWTQIASTTSRSSATSFVINGKGYVGLGVRSSTFLTDLFEYDPTINTWTQKASLPAQGRYGAAGFTIGNVGYICCGNFGAGGGPYTTEVFGYDATTDCWSPKAPFPGMARYGGRGEAINDLGYVVGGINGIGTSSSYFFTDLWEYNATLDNWTQKANLPGLGRNYATTFVMDGKFVVGNGVHYTGYLSDFYMYQPSTNSWSNLPSMPANESRWSAVGLSNGNSGYVVSGNQSLNNPIVITNDVWQLSLPSPLPIELISFEATVVNNEKVKLNWVTATEFNNDYFTIERSSNGTDFNTVSNVDAAGNSNSVLEYIAYDNAPLNGVSYYRLKQTDFDGASTWSHIQMVRFMKNIPVIVYPNPITGNVLHITAGNEIDMIREITFHDLSGKLIHSVNGTALSIHEGITQIDLANNLNKGVYVIEINTPTAAYREWIVKQ